MPVTTVRPLVLRFPRAQASAPLDITVLQDRRLIAQSPQGAELAHIARKDPLQKSHVLLAHTTPSRVSASASTAPPATSVSKETPQSQLPMSLRCVPQVTTVLKRRVPRMVLSVNLASTSLRLVTGSVCSAHLATSATLLVR